MTLTSSPYRRRAAALLPALALTGAALLAPSGPASAAPGAGGLESPAQASASWAAAQLADDTHASGDHGLTADIVIGIAATGTGGETATKATDWLAEGAEEYISRGVSGDVNAGATAKLALVAGVEQRDMASFGGVDLLTTLTERMQDNGRFTDDTVSGDLSNQFTQSLAVLALQRAGAVPREAADFLANTRCADGGYPLSLRSDPDNCNADVDSTGLAVQAMLATDRVADATPALDWLEQQQNADGSFAYDGGGADGNSNSTALAVQALAAGDRTQAADKGVAWLRTLQLGCEAAPEDRGAVGYMKPVVDGTTLRATAQVIPALAGKSLGEIDSEGRAPELAEIDCGPGDDSGGGTSGTTGGSSGDSTSGTEGGTSGDTTSGTEGGTDGSTTGTDGGSTTAGTGGTDVGGADSGGTDGVTGGAATGDGGLDPASGGGGSLAASGAGSALPLAAGAGLLLLLGMAAVFAVRLRRAG